MNTKRKLNLVKKNFYFAIVVVALLFVAGFVIAAYDASKASHGTLYTDRIETKSQTDDTIEVAAKLDVLGLLINGTPLGVLGGSGLQDIKLIITSYDKNKNDVIDQFELLNAIDDWTNLKISGRVLGIIHEMWASQFSISGLPSNIGVFDYNLFNAFSTYLYSAYFKGGRGVRIDGNLTVNGNVQASGTICDKNGCIGSGDSGIGGVGAKIYSDINNSYIELTSDVSWADLASVSLPAYFSGGETYIHFTAPIAKDGAFKVRLTLDGNPLTTTPAIDLDAGQDYLKEAIRGAPLSLSYVVSNLTAGEHTIKAQWIGFKSGVLPNAGNKGYALIEEGSARAMTVIIAGDVSQDGGGSGGGASLPTCSNGQVLKYNSAVGKWECADGGGSGGGEGTPPLKFEVYNPDTTTYACVEKDLEEYCGDEDGCTIRLLLQHEIDGNDQVRIIDEHIYMEQTTISNNKGAGIYGWTRQGGGGEYSWITGTTVQYDIAYPWSWMWIKNYKHDWCDGQVGNGPAFTNPYQFSFMSHPHVRTTVIVYDSIGGGSGGGSGGGVSFGAWEVKNLNQVYTAATDGVVLAFCYASNSANGVTPDGTLPRTGCEASGTQADGFTIPVREGDTWKVYLTSGVGNVDVYWIPLEGGGGSGASLPTCSNAQILKYNSATGKWECANSGGGGGATYDSGWFAVVGDTGPYGTPNTILTHNLGTINIITEILFAPDSGGAPDLSRVYRVDHLEQDGWFQGATIKEITTTSLTIDPPRLVFRRWTSGWYKVLAMSID